MGEAYALNISLLRQAARDLGIRTDAEFYELLREWETEVLLIWAEQRKKEKPCDEAQRRKCEVEFPDYLEWACSQCKKNPENKKGDDSYEQRG